MSLPKFTNAPVSFHGELKKRVNAYFDQTGQSATGNTLLYIKAFLFGIAMIALYIHLVFYTPASWLAILECIVLGGVISAIGFNVMHDGAHGSFSKYKPVNVLAAYSLNILGGSS